MNDDLISRDAVLDACSQSINILDAMSRIEDLPSVTQKSETVTEFADRCKECGSRYGKLLAVKESKTEQFAKWVATEIFDDMWEYNKDAFAEIACRKLEKLGIVRAKGDEWELVAPQESEEQV